MFSIEKQFNIKDFLASYTKLSNRDKRTIKIYFIKYINLLIEREIIETRFHVIKNGVTYETTSLTSDDISEGFIIYEKLTL